MVVAVSPLKDSAIWTELHPRSSRPRREMWKRSKRVIPSALCPLNKRVMH
jgi:hypothetical protein